MSSVSGSSVSGIYIPIYRTFTMKLTIDIPEKIYEILVKEAKKAGTNIRAFIVEIIVDVAQIISYISDSA